MKAATIAHIILLWLGTFLLIGGLMARADSLKELQAARIVDIATGLILAAAVFLAPARQPRRLRSKLLISVAIVVTVAGVLISLQEYYVYLRLRNRDMAITRSHISQSYKAITAYSKDCGCFPSEQQGLAVLLKNPGLSQWKGPYLSDEAATADIWNRPLHYALRGDAPVVTSCGKDGVFGTKDDIALEARPD